ncbi:hypothetical protein [Streptomyces himastatinicus]|uniref:hypothetical protein n=1 Tax=Streptomyces himastatinicus TaxID=998084 RepID=UPI0012B6944D|nr:hypothetical protein [Streptomyces himastatinicus]
MTREPEARRTELSERFTQVQRIPSYRAVLDREGASGPADTAVLGEEAAVERALRALAEAGATELIASPVGTPDEQSRTKELLAALSSRT